jgi:hypothetical protein
MTITNRFQVRHGLLLSAFLLAPLPAYPQTALTGAIQFSANSSGAAYGGLLWNTLAGDTYYDLWLARSPDATSPVNGPSDSLAGIDITLEEGNSYQFFIFGQPGPGDITGFNGLNLFFDGNSVTPGISVSGATNSARFLPDSSGTLTLQGASVAGSGSTSYRSGGVIVTINGYDWNAPATPPGDVCQAFGFSPGDGADYFGSFTLQAWPAASLTLSQAKGSPGTKIAMMGSGFAPSETVHISIDRAGARLFLTVTTDADGSFTVTAPVVQHPHGPMELYAVGLSSGKLGAATLFVTPALAMNPGSVAPGGTTEAQALGFGAGEAVDIYWSNPRRLLGTATANEQGSGALTITVPANASPGINGLFGIGETSHAIGIGEVVVR